MQPSHKPGTTHNLKYNNFIALGISLIIIGIFYLLRFLTIINAPITELISYVFILYGIVTVYFSLGTGFRGRLFFASIVFLSGVMMYVINNYEILKPSSAIFASILFITGSSFVILFIDNTKEKTFLYSGLLLLIISYSAATVFKNYEIIKAANSLSNLVLDYWPVFLLLFGINILIMRKR